MNKNEILECAFGFISQFFGRFLFLFLLVFFSGKFWNLLKKLKRIFWKNWKKEVDFNSI